MLAASQPSKERVNNCLLVITGVILRKAKHAHGNKYSGGRDGNQMKMVSALLPVSPDQPLDSAPEVIGSFLKSSFSGVVTVRC